MSKVKFNHQVRYLPGTVPCPNAEITIYDVDAGGNGDDVIFTATTNSQGYFKGWSKDWEDKNTARVRLFPGGPWITSNIPDQLVLMIRIKVDGKDTGKLPLVLTPSGLPVPPIILPFPKPPTSVPAVTVNGQACADAFDLQVKARAAFESGTSTVKIAIRGPEASVFLPLAGDLDQLKPLVDDLLPGAAEMLYPNPVGAGEIFAIAAVILAIGAAGSVGTFATGVAFCMVLALVLGYCQIDTEMLPSGSNANGVSLPGIEFSVKKC